MKDIDFLDTVVENIKSRIGEGNIITKVMVIVLLPIWTVLTSREPFKVKFFLGIIALIIYPFYLAFLLIIFPLLLLASIFLELRDITFRKMLGFLPNMLVIIAGLIIIEFLGMVYAFGNALNQLSGTAVVLDTFGNVDTFSELYRKVTDIYLPIQVVLTIITIIGYGIAFYFFFFRKREEEYLTYEEQEGVKSFIKKSFYYLPVLHIYILLLLVWYIFPPLIGGEDARTEFYFMHFFTFYTIVWATLGLVIFVVILIISEGFVKRWFEDEVVAKVKRKDEKKPDDGGEGMEMGGDEEIIEEIMDPKEEEQKFTDPELTEQAEELVQEEMEEKFDEEVEKRAEELVEEEKENSIDDDEEER